MSTANNRHHDISRPRTLHNVHRPGQNSSSILYTISSTLYDHASVTPYQYTVVRYSPSQILLVCLHGSIENLISRNESTRVVDERLTAPQEHPTALKRKCDHLEITGSTLHERVVQSLGRSIAAVCGTRDMVESPPDHILSASQQCYCQGWESSPC